jgi:glycosyltransferase involved in cell wall biosynthesis
MVNFSFIIPIYNGKDYITDCVDSILILDRDDYEIIIVDDGSIDSTAEMCQMIVKRNSKIRYIYQKNSGVSSARNTGLKKAMGEYVLFLDADDTINAYRLEEVLNNLLHYKTIDMVIFGMGFDYYYNGKCYRRDELGPKENVILDKNAWILQLKELFEENCLSSICNKIIKKTVIEKNNLYFRTDMFYYEDLEMTFRILSHCNYVMFNENIIYNYRQAEDEGNAGRRLLKIPQLSDLADVLEDSIVTLLNSVNKEGVKEQKDYIILKLYLTWAREKIYVSNLKEIKSVQQEFITWLKCHKIEIVDEQKKDVYLLCNKKPIYFCLKKIYISIRHSVAIALKRRGIINSRRG